ncbi:MAG TPA: hypothetical protein VII06_26715 [Chloroflexota bacterium]|jgi:hypothetical protein
MNNLQSYDGDLEMFREAPRSVDMARLRFLRWLADRGCLEHPAAGPPSGELAAAHAAHQPSVAAA